MESYQRSGFAKLSTEMIWAIIGFIDPASHLDFACTCKHIAHCSSGVLQRHQHAYEKYHVCSDLDPTTVPTLLESVFGFTDPIPAWHVRSFEVWRDRNSWPEWQTYDLHTPIEYDESQGSSIGRHANFGDFEVDTLSSEQQIAAITETEEGHDGVLKAFLLAHLPRLRDIKFITQAHDPKSTLNWLTTIIATKIPGMGFESLVSVAVGIPSNTWMDDSDSPTLPVQMFATLLTLPNIESIYYNDFVCNEDDDEFDWKAILPEKSSNVKHIFLDDCNNIPYYLQEALTASPRSLVSMSFRCGTGSGDRMDDVDRTVTGLARNQSTSLDSLMFYGYSAQLMYNRIHGYRCAVFLPETLRGLSLKNVSFVIGDMEVDALYHHDGQKHYDPEFWKEHAFNDLPRTMETLTLWGDAGFCHFGEHPGQTESAEVMVISLMEMGGFPNLAAIYLEEIERRGEGREVETPRSDKVAFQRAVQVGKKLGIDVHTITNRSTPRHRRDFPEAPDAYDLVTGLYKGRRPSDFVFDVFLGRRVPPGCGKCGKCDDCLATYTKELWETIPSIEGGGE